MDVREKLVELQSIITCPNAICNFCEHFKNKDACEKHKKEVIADNMVAHGVTVQELISVKDRLPEKPMKCLVYTKRGEYGGYEITYYNEGFYLQYANVTHWMTLPDEPQPPKGE